MKIYSMTATFGKLEHATLTLKPGLNIIEAPNEWGKSTWCAFLVNMLYGIDTRARAKGTELPDKERYAPWSGSAMSGRIDLNWNGRDITIERRTRGRIPFGDFSAYETNTGVEIPELTATNCGELLLGVERNVFTRAGFLKLSDLPVTQDDALRRRLNNLVTTGDESGAGDQLGKQLKDLKNKCRHNQTGLLPQAEREREQLQHQQDALYALQKRSEDIRSRQNELTQQTAALENHQAALLYAASMEDIQKIADAQEALRGAEASLAQQEAACNSLPPREALQEKQLSARQLQEQLLALPLQSQLSMPAAIELPAVYQNKTPDQIRAEAQADLDANDIWEKQRRTQNAVITGIGIALLVILAGLLAVALLIPGLDKAWLVLAGAVMVAVGIATLVWGAVRAKKQRRGLDALYDRHPGVSPNRWLADAQMHAANLEQYQSAVAAYDQAAAQQNAQREAIEDAIAACTDGQPLKDMLPKWEQALAAWRDLEDRRREVMQLRDHTKALQSMAKTVEPPKFPDQLTATEQETAAQLAAARFEQKQLQLELGQCLGRADALGTEATLRARLDSLNRRINRLEDIYHALEMAQEALREASTTLQRRFAPRISKRAQELFSKLTQGRYQRITLGENLSLSACAENEDTLRPAEARSDGTIDQLYLALRLAVAEELTPNAPLVLDDALVRFDDRRLKVALDILKEEAQAKQVILFTCQNRETRLAE